MLTTPRSKMPPTRTVFASWQVLLPAETHPYWWQLLGRSGVPARSLDSLGEGSLEASIVFLAGGPRSAHRVAQVGDLCARGVPIVADARWASALTGRRARTVDAIGITGRGPRFADCGEIRFDAPVAILDDARGTALDAATAGLDGMHAGRVWPGGARAVSILDAPGPIVVLPLPDAGVLVEPRTRSIAFAHGPRGAACEIVAAVDHAALRRFVRNALRGACFDRGLPFVHLAHAPGAGAGAFVVRIDADDFDAQATRTTLASLHAGNVRATWFIDVERHERKGGAPSVAGIVAAGHEVQSHFHHHYTYRSFARNRANLVRSIGLLRRWGIETNAAAAPFGTWNHGLERAICTARLAYSSEFSRAYDDLPWRPTTTGGGGTEVSAWQMPVHPICPLVLLEAGFDEAAVHAYFALRLEAGLALGEPVVFYAHPIRDLERVPGLFTELDRVIGAWQSREGAEVWRGTLGELHAFERARAEQRLECSVGPDGVRGETDGPASAVVEHPGARPEHFHGRFAAQRCPEENLVPRASIFGHGGEHMPDEWSAATLRLRRRRQRRIEMARLVRELRD